MSTDPQSRKWALVINNPKDCGLDHDAIIETLHLFRPAYFCLADEIGESGTYHTHIYLFSHSPIRFSTVKNRFPPAHIEKALGTSMENRDYITKSGKWANTKKAETSVADTFFEFGEVPSPAEEDSPAMYALMGCVEQGMTNAEIVRSKPSFAFKLKNIDELRDTIQAERHMKENRPIRVYYLYGDSGTGKTYSILAKHGAENVCRITDYGGRNGVRFDAYHGQSVLVFEEFHSQIPITAMLNYLDIYPLQLPARYHDRTACYTTVYITSNISLEEQYPDIQRSELETWRAFQRRIHTVIEFRRGQPPKEHPNDTR